MIVRTYILHIYEVNSCCDDINRLLKGWTYGDGEGLVFPIKFTVELSSKFLEYDCKDYNIKKYF